MLQDLVAEAATYIQQLQSQNIQVTQEVINQVQRIQHLEQRILQLEADNRHNLATIEQDGVRMGSLEQRFKSMKRNLSTLVHEEVNRILRERELKGKMRAEPPAPEPVVTAG